MIPKVFTLISLFLIVIACPVLAVSENLRGAGLAFIVGALILVYLMMSRQVRVFGSKK